jgi:diguanylate cyclase (GGDEF)-like protein
MISMANAQFERSIKDRLLFVSGRLGDGDPAGALRRYLPDWTVATADSYLAGIADLCNASARAVLVQIEPTRDRFARVVAGLREAAPEARLVLCCPPEWEAWTRRILECGADDYVLLPLDEREVCKALDLTAPREQEATRVSPTKSPSLDAPAELGAALAGVADGSKELLERAAALIGSAAAEIRKWRALALTDECTGLPNRRYLTERMRSILQEAEARRLPVTLLLFDIDDFKSFNDRFGHVAGDRVLRLVGRLFRQHCRDQDVVTRYGGDEFAVVFWDPEGPRVPGSKHPDCALDVLERFQRALRGQSVDKLLGEDAGMGAEIRLTISGGLATYPWSGNAFPALLAHADEALLAAKRAGRSRVLVFGQADTPPGFARG